MATSTLQGSGRRPRAATPQKQTQFLPHPRKLNVALTGEEQLLATQLARVLARPGQLLTMQDALRIGLAQLGVIHAKQLAVGTDNAAA